MSFFDELSKTKTKPEFVQPTGFCFTEKERREVVRCLCDSIKRGCAREKSGNRHAYRGYCLWTKRWEYPDHSESYLKADGWCDENINNLTKHYCTFCTNAERDLILKLLREELAKDGFPSNVVTPYDHNRFEYEGVVFQKKIPWCVYSIEVNVRW